MSPEELQSCFDGLIALHKLEVRVNDPTFYPKGLYSLDVEHDEQGGFVGCGFYNGGTCHYINDLVLLNHIDFSALSLVCHNGVSDFDCLRQWGIDVKDTQLYWDTGLYAHILDSSRQGYGLKTLAAADLNIHYPSYDDIVGKRTLKQVKERKTLDKWPVDLVSKYNSLDTYCAWRLYENQKKNTIRTTI
jgi:DNA polymerase I-like protein with 3'-5' exonuclease and polymerase domains